MLDFQKRKKKYFDVTLHDGTKLKIPAPSMQVYTAMKEVTEDPDIDNLEEEIGRITKEVLNTNKQGIEITDEHIEAFDAEDLTELFISFAEFIKTVLADPS